MLLIVAYGAARWSFSIATVAAALGLASLLVGALIGFLFGIPRTLTADTVPADGTAPPSYRPNTNLEQISDWLTKILVGVGLIELGRIGGGFGKLVTFVEPALGADRTAGVFGLFVAVYFLVAGFLGGYLVTRLVLTPELASAERQIHEVAVQAARDEVDRRDDADADALALVTRQLSGEDTDEKKLAEAVAAASRVTKIEVFFRAHNQRRDNWRSDKEAVERTIPVFRALTASDPERKYHRNFGELGFALKDKPEPDWAGALEALDAAIESRDRAKGRGYRIYEFNRAVCRIRLDPAFAAGQPSAPDSKAAITAELRTAAKGVHSGAVVATDETVRAWAELNEVDVSSL